MSRLLDPTFGSRPSMTTNVHTIQSSEAANFTGYYTEFCNLRRAYPNREQSLSQAILRALQGKDLSNVNRVLDVGAADGKLLTMVLKHLSNPPRELVCVEPGEAAFASLEQEAITWPGTVRLISETAEDYLIQQRQEKDEAVFDLILCSHTYYHFHDPVEITDALCRSLTPSGHLVIILDSHTSQFYEFLSRCLISCNPSLGHAYGAYVGSERLDALFREASFSFEQHDKFGRLVIPNVDTLYSVAEFLGRNQLMISQYLRNFLSSHEPPFIFNWKEGLFVMNRTGAARGASP